MRNKYGEQARILLVEDNSWLLRGLSVLLESDGCSVAPARSFKEAVALGTSEPFDLILCDIGLPDGDGRQIPRYVAQNGEAKVIALTGFSDPWDVAEAPALGFFALLTKPVNPDVLRATLKKALNV